MFLLYVVLVTIMFSSAYCAGGICDASEFPDENARPVADEIETAKYSGRWYPVSTQLSFHTPFFFKTKLIFTSTLILFSNLLICEFVRPLFEKLHHFHSLMEMFTKCNVI